MVIFGILIFGNYYISIMKNFNFKIVYVLKILFYLFDSVKWLNEKGDYLYFFMFKLLIVLFIIFIYFYIEMYVVIVDILVII